MSAYERGEPALIERIQLRRTSRSTGFANVRLPGVNLTGLRIEERPDGRLICMPPVTTGRDGRHWPIYALQPGWREAVEREVACLWARSA